MHHIFATWKSMEKLLKQAHLLSYFFNDFKVAYDKIGRVKLYTAMSQFDIATKLIRLTGLSFTDVLDQMTAVE